MRSLRNCLLLVATFYLCQLNVYAIDLDAPIQKKPTARTEIERGSDAGWRCHLDNLMSPEGMNKCVTDIVYVNSQNKDATEPFLLGLYFQAWSATVSPHVNENEFDFKNEQFQRSYRFFYFQDYRKLQRKLKISDKYLYNNMHAVPKDCKEIIDLWRKGIESTKIKK